MTKFIPLHSCMDAVFHIHATDCSVVATKRRGLVRGDVIEAATPKDAVAAVKVRENRDDLTGKICGCARKAAAAAIPEQSLADFIKNGANLKREQQLSAARRRLIQGGR